MAKTRYEVLDTKTGIKLSLDKFFQQHMEERIVNQVIERLEAQADETVRANFLKKMIVKDQPGNGKRKRS